MRVQYRNFSVFYFLFFIAMGVFTTLFPIHLAELGLNSGLIGLIISIGLLASIIGPPVWGFLSDHLQARKKILLFCQLSAIIICFILSGASQPFSLIILYFTYYFFQNAIGPLSDSLVMGTLGADKYGKVRLWGSVGFAVGAFLCGRLLGNMPSNRVFIAYLAVSLIAMAFSAYSLPMSSSNNNDKLSFDKVLKLVGQRQFCFLLAVLLLVLIPYGSYVSFLGLYLREVGAKPWEIGLAWTIGALSEVPLFLWGGKYIKALNAWYFLALSAVIFGFRWLLCGYFGSKNLLIILQVSGSISFGVFYLAAIQLVNRLTPDGLKSLGQTIFAAVGFGLSFSLGNLFGGYFAEYYGFPAMFAAAGYMAMLGGLLASLVAIRVGRRQV